MTADPLLAQGREVGGYRIEYLLGAGGMGAVYAAVEPTIGRRVAVKVLLKDLATDEVHAQRFEREARSVSLLRHPAIVDVFSFGKLEDGRPFFVMPLYEGRTLREEIARAGKIAPAEAWRIAREIAEGLEAAHGAGILHRDLKPDNVFMSSVAGRRAQPVLLDFGLAKWIDTALEDASIEDRVKLTNTGVPLGTPIYMAPEQWWSTPMTAATDQYAFGIVLFEMLTGRPPFNSQKFPELLQQHLHEAPPSLASLDVQAPAGVERVLRRLMAKDSKDRFASFTEVIAQGDAAFAEVSEAVHAPIGERAPPVEPSSDALPAARTELAVAATSNAAAPGPAAGVIEPETKGTPDLGRLGAHAMGPFVACVLAAIGTLLAIGYAGEERWVVSRWITNAGFGGPVVLLAGLLSAILVPRYVARIGTDPSRPVIAQLIAVAPAPLAILSVYTGWQKVIEGVDTIPDAITAFAVLHQGRYEIGSCDFMGFALAAGVSLGLTALLGSPRPRLSRAIFRSPWIPLAIVCIASIPVMLALHVTSPVFTVVIGAGALLWLGFAALAPTWKTAEMAVAALSATFAARAVSQVRADVHAATSWMEPTTRAERVVAMMNAHRDRAANSVITTGVLLLVAGACIHAIAKARSAGTIVHRSLAQRIFATLQVVFVILLFGMSVQIDRAFEERRAALVARMNEQLVLYAHLSPPTMENATLPPPVQSPTLQITSDAVALNGKGIGKLSALDADSGRQAMAASIVAALATPTTTKDRTVDLSLLVDRSVPWRRVEELLGIAFEGGARSVDFLLTRGAEPSIPKNAPPEVANLLPRDFGALGVVLSGEGVELEDASFGDVSADLLQRHEHATNVVALKVRRARLH